MKQVSQGRCGLALAFAVSVAACSGDDGSGAQRTITPTVTPPTMTQPVAAAGPPAPPIANPTPVVTGPSPMNAGAGGTAVVPMAGSGVLPLAGSGAMTLAGSGGSAAAGAGGSGMAPPGGMGTGSDCPAPPAGASAEAITAHMTLNAIRVPAGAGCINEVPELNMSALSHCQYNAGNAGNASCMAGGHSEVMSCMGFTGVDVAAREKTAGYSAVGATEVLTSYGNMPAPAVQSWVDTVWHRIPMLDPWTTDMGYGGAARCDVIDFGKGTTGAPTDTVVVYPYDGQTDVPPSFNGLESPLPIAPASGWPSGYPVNVYAQGLKVTEHVITKDGDTTPIEHVWMDMSSPEVDPGYKFYLRTTAFMYTNTPLAANTKYRVKMTGTRTGGTLNLEWTFTTGAMRRF